MVSWFRHDLFVYYSAVLGAFGAGWLAFRYARGQRAEPFARPSPLHGVLHVAGAALAAVLLLWVPVVANAGASRVLNDIYFDQLHHTMPARVLPLPSLTQLGAAPVDQRRPAGVLARARTPRD